MNQQETLLRLVENRRHSLEGGIAVEIKVIKVGGVNSHIDIGEMVA